GLRVHYPPAQDYEIILGLRVNGAWNKSQPRTGEKQSPQPARIERTHVGPRIVAWNGLPVTRRDPKTGFRAVCQPNSRTPSGIPWLRLNYCSDDGSSPCVPNERQKQLRP